MPAGTQDTPSPAARSPAASAGADRPILVVDDDDDIREIVAIVLGEEGYPIVTAANGAEAIARLRRTELPRPRLILLDLMMPVMNAQELRDAMDADGGPPIPIVVLSGDTQVAAKAAKLGAAAAISKAISLERLLSVVAEQS